MADQVRIIVNPSDTEAGSFNIYEYRFDANGNPQVVPFLIASNVPLSSLISPGYLISIDNSSYGIILEDVADRGLGCSGSTVEQLYSDIKISNGFSVTEGSIDIISASFGTLLFIPLPSQNNSLYYHIDTGTTVEDITNIEIFNNEPSNTLSYVLTVRDSESVSPFVSSDTILPNTGKTINFNNTFLSPNKLFMITLSSIAPTPSVTPSITTSKSPSPTKTMSPFITPSKTPPGMTPSKTPSTSIIVSNVIVSSTPSLSTTMTPFATPSRTPPGITPSVTPSKTPTITPSLSISRTPSKTPSKTPTVTSSPSTSVTPSLSISKTPLATPSLSVSKTPSLSISKTPSKTPSLSISTTPSLSISKTPSPSRSNTPSITLSTAYMIWKVTVDTFTTTIASCEDPRDGTKYSAVGRTPANLTTLYNDTGLTSIYIAGGTHPGYISFSTGGGVVYSGSQNSGGTISSNTAC